MSSTKTEKAIKDKMNPKDDWMTFPLIKIKFTSDVHRQCENYNLTSQAEDDDKDEDEGVGVVKRNRMKKKLPDGFVRNELSDSDEEGHSDGGVKLPNYPAPPEKLQPIQDKDVMSSPDLFDTSGSRETRETTPGSRHSTRSETIAHNQRNSVSQPRSRSTSTPQRTHTTSRCNRSGSKSGGARYGQKSGSSSGARYRRRSGSSSDDARHPHQSGGYSDYQHRSGSERESSRDRQRFGSNRTPTSSRSYLGNRDYIRYSHTSDSPSDRHSDRHRFGSERESSRDRQRFGSNRTPTSSRSYLSPPHHTPSPNAGTGSGRWTFPMPWDVYQKRVLGLLIDLKNQYKMAQPTTSSAHIEKIGSMEEFQDVEQRLCDKDAFDALVAKIAKIGGKSTKDCVHKVLDGLFTNALMSQFNMKGRGKKAKKPLELTKTFRAIQDGVMQFDTTATVELIKMYASDHLKHAPQRSGGGGFTTCEGT
ncbi:myb-like protein V [Melanotaenia boesemani]|uniref:myb-like protein V n=1 Tax=Melanotaenia boesemani TaxID=1250792 RepID=UPI001C04A0D8|nr:myb-like protein V [Melanotaenia boesemani]